MASYLNSSMQALKLTLVGDGSIGSYRVFNFVYIF